MALSSIKLIQTLEWAKRFISQRPTALGNFNEPAVSSANTVLQTIVSPPFSWPWNRAVTGFVCVPGQQDYTLFNWQVATNVSAGTVTVDSNGNSQIVTTGGVTGSTAPTWNPTTGQVTNDGSTVVWMNSGPIGLSGGSTTYNFGWIETASIKATNPNTSAQEWKEIEVKLCLSAESAKSRPHDISAQLFDSLGNVTFRLMPCPDQAYPVSITIQQKPTLITSLNGTWAPIPDSYSHIYNWGMLSLLFLFTDDPRAQMAEQKFLAHILSSSQGLTQTQFNIFLSQWQTVTGLQQTLPASNQQGIQGRGSV
jgi:hypothetical protein